MAYEKDQKNQNQNPGRSIDPNKQHDQQRPGKDKDQQPGGSKDTERKW